MVYSWSALAPGAGFRTPSQKLTMAYQSATARAESAPASFEKDLELQPITLSDDLACNLDRLSADELRGICERLREEFQRRTLALASAVHELRTPLAIMDGYTELLHTGKAGPKKEKQIAILED